MNKIDTEWVGFCQYRKFLLKEIIKKDIILRDLEESIIKKIDSNTAEYDCILGNKFSVENYKFSKIIKHHFFKFILNPVLLIDKKKRSLKFHFDLFHGNGNLEKAINLLDDKNKEEFMIYMQNETSFHPHNMFICKTKILKEYYDIVLPWLEKCEQEFGFSNLSGYGLKRIYGFLAERFLSFWFSKNYKVKKVPIIVKDISSF